MVGNWLAFAVVAGTSMLGSHIALGAAAPELFSPPVGTVLEYRVTIVRRLGSEAPRTIIITARNTFVENDGLHSKAMLSETDATRNGVSTPITKIPSENYSIYFLYQLSRQSISRFTENGLQERIIRTSDCDKAAIQSLLPLGSVVRVNVTCNLGRIVNGVARSIPNNGIISKTVFYDGNSQMVEGDHLVDVAIIRTEYDVGLDHYSYVLFTDTTRGIVVKSVDEVTYEVGAEAGSNRTTVELVAIR